MIKVAISGFGRIGRNFLRCVLLDSQALKRVQVVAINIGPEKLDFTAHMFKYDTIMGTYPGIVKLEGNELVIDDHRIKIVAQTDARNLPWKSMGIDWVVECSGKYTKRDAAQHHVDAGAKRILISAPAKDEDVSIIPGVNDAAYDPQRHHIVSLGSCTTNALLPMLEVIHHNFIIEHCMMTTIHSYTNSQVLLDVQAKDLRESRAAALNIIPTTTGVSHMVAKVIPSLANVFQAISIRVPTAKVSLVDLTFNTKKALTVESINSAFKKASEVHLKGILAVTRESLVSCDFSGNPHSVIIDSLLTSTVGEHMGKAFGWYDNEWGYSERLKDFLVKHG
jgi:glyceraldehyde 3-phosphate dehydrogenase